MTSLTIFTAPKPFTDSHIATIQRNAIRSWQRLGDDIDVILIGNEKGMSEVAKDLAVAHVPEVEYNQMGTPLVSSIFALAEKTSDSPLLAYVNCDILLLSDFLEVALQIKAQRSKFLVVGQRWDLDIDQPLEFGENWGERLREEASMNGQMHVPSGSDYFIYPRGLLSKIPDFAIGRAGWDNWMIYNGVKQPWPLVDATPSIRVIHQNHDYAHLPGGKPHYRLEETFENAELGGGMANMYMILDANLEFRDGQLKRPRFRLARLVRILERAVYPKSGLQQGPRWGLTRKLRRLRRRLV